MRHLFLRPDRSDNRIAFPQHADGDIDGINLILGAPSVPMSAAALPKEDEIEEDADDEPSESAAASRHHRRAAGASARGCRLRGEAARDDQVADRGCVPCGLGPVRAGLVLPRGRMKLADV